MTTQDTASETTITTTGARSTTRAPLPFTSNPMPITHTSRLRRTMRCPIPTTMRRLTISTRC